MADQMWTRLFLTVVAVIPMNRAQVANVNCNTSCLSFQNVGTTIIGSTDMSHRNISNPFFSINSYSYNQNGRCMQEIAVKGNGVSDSFQVPCPQNGFNSLNSDNLLVFGDTTAYTFALYSDTPSVLVVIQDGKCTKKVYNITNSGTTSTSYPLSDSECSELKRKMADQVEKNKKYWREWGRNFTEHLAAQFPPGFPFHNQQTRHNNAHEPSYDDFDSSSKSTATGSSGWWDQWSKNFTQQMDQTMKKSFPPGFPFHNKNP